MTTPETNAPVGNNLRKSPRLVWILLLASLGFNVFFAVGYWSALDMAHQMQTFEGRARKVAAQLNLDERQQQVYERMLAQLKQKRIDSRKARLPKTEAFLAELIKNQPDEQALLAYAQRDESLEYRKAMILMMRDFVAILNPQQRQTLVQIMKQKAESTQ